MFPSLSLPEHSHLCVCFQEAEQKSLNRAHLLCIYLWEQRWRCSFSPVGLPSHRADLDLGKLSRVKEFTEGLYNIKNRKCRCCSLKVRRALASSFHNSSEQVWRKRFRVICVAAFRVSNGKTKTRGQRCRKPTREYNKSCHQFQQNYQTHNLPIAVCEARWSLLGRSEKSLGTYDCCHWTFWGYNASYWCRVLRTRLGCVVVTMF